MHIVPKTKRALRIWAIVGVVVFGSVLFIASNSIQIRAATFAFGNNAGCLYGYAWSDNIGWISLRSNSSCASAATYGVYVSETDGVTLGGYAWSDSVGWISFNGGTDSNSSNPDELSACPAGIGETYARLTGIKTTPQLNGCARAVSSNGGGWDGYISLGQSLVAGTPNSPSAGLISMNGYGWGSDVVGWISYGAAGANVTLDYTECNDGIDNDSAGGADLLDSDCDNGTTGTTADDRIDNSETGAPPPSAGGTLTASPTATRVGGSTTLSWTNITGSPTSCRITSSTPPPATPATYPYTLPSLLAGSHPADDLQQGTYTFTLKCTVSGVEGDVDSVQVTVAPIPSVREI